MGLFTQAILKANQGELPSVDAPADTPYFGTARASDVSAAVDLENALDVLWAQMIQPDVRPRTGIGQAFVMAHWEPSEGATTIATALAHRVAELDPTCPICLADFDFNSAGLSRLLGLESALGVSNVLLGESSFEEAIAATRLTNLSVLPVGHPNVGRQVTQLYDRCQELCGLLASRFHYVFLDVPPLRKQPNFAFWAAGHARAVLVVRAGQARQPAVAKALQILQLMRLDVAGVALNAREFYVPRWLYNRT